MVQSVASPQADVLHAKAPAGSWEHKMTGLRFALGSVKQKVLSYTWFLRKPLDYDISSSAAIDRIAARLAVEERARAEAGSEHPPSTEETLRGTQGEVVHYFRVIQQKAHRQVANAAERMRRVGSRVDPQNALRTLLDIPSRTRNAVQRVNADAAAKLELARLREDQQRQHYEAFRKANRLERFATYSASPIVYYLMAFALVVLVVFSLGRSSIVGIEAANPVTIAHAVPIALLGVIAPFAVGAGIFRSINHVDALERFTAWVAAGMTMLFVAALAYFSALYAMTLATSSDATLQSTVVATLNDPLQVTGNLAAWRVFGIVSLSGLLAFLVGYRADDPYPEYGDVQRAYYTARTQRERLTERLRRRINRIIDSSERDVNKVRRRLKANARRYFASVQKLENQRGQIDEFEVALEDSCGLVLERYRTANRTARMTEAPLSFAEHVSFRTDEDPNEPLLHDGMARIQEIERGIDEFEVELVKIRHELRDIDWLAINDLSGAATSR